MTTYYLVYKTTNIVNGKVYIGCHKTQKLDDSYLGSGALIKRAIAKYGPENFKREILECFDNSDDMFKMESILVDQLFVNNATNYNLKVGGEGGFGYINDNKLNQYSQNNEAAKAGRIKANHTLLAMYGPTWNTTIGKKGYAASLEHRSLEEQQASVKKAAVKSNTPAAIIKKKATFAAIQHQQGANNSQFGTCWITNGVINKKVKKTDLQQYTETGWRLGRITK